jgi:hypothetical protein
VTPHRESEGVFELVAGSQSSILVGRKKASLWQYTDSNLQRITTTISVPDFLISPTMADPTKAETDHVFKVLKSQKGNKVRKGKQLWLIREAEPISVADVFRLSSSQSDMVQCLVRRIYMPRLLKCASKHGRAHQFRQVCTSQSFYLLFFDINFYRTDQRTSTPGSSANCEL